MVTLKTKYIILYSILIFITLLTITIDHKATYRDINVTKSINYKTEDNSIKKEASEEKKLLNTKSFRVMSYNIHRAKNEKHKNTLNDMIILLNESNADIVCLQEVTKSQHERIREMTYNIHRAKNEKHKNTLNDMIILLNESNADIVCLQEVTKSQHERIREMTKTSAKFVSNAKRAIVSDGVATYSKYPIVESKHVLLTSKNEQRGFLHTSYKIDGKLINVINVHLGLNKSERATQISEILEYIEKLEGETILAGDFNERYVRLDSFTDTGKYHGYGNKPTFEALDTRIDYIFITTNSIYSTTYDVLKTDLSDHYPIITKIRQK